jgi:AcrR family transcriptional regulator
VASARELETLTPPPHLPSTSRGRRTRSQLIVGARVAFEKNGYLDTRVVDITEAAGVSYGTFYTYFTSREEIFAEVVDALLADFQEIARAEPLVGRTPAAGIERANRGYLRAYRKNARMMAVLEQAATLTDVLRDVRRGIRGYWVDRSRAAIERWQREGLVDAAIDAYYAATSLGGMVNRSAYVWMVLGEPYDEDTAVEQLTLLYCRALGLLTH